MRRLLYLTVLSMLVVAMTASVALAQPQRAPSGADGSYNCADFDTQTQAQNYYEGQGGVSGGDPDGLDADQDGIACETLPTGEPPQPTTPEPTTEQPTTPEPTTEQPQPQPEGGNGDVPRGTGGVGTNQYDDDDDVGGLPHTGGPSLGASASLLGGVALLAGGLLLRRRLS